MSSTDALENVRKPVHQGLEQRDEDDPPLLHPVETFSARIGNVLKARGSW